MGTSRGNRIRQRAFAVLLGLAVAFLAAEGGLRILLFCDLPPLERLARSLRQPAFYAEMRFEDAFWKLQHMWFPPNPERAFGPLHPTLGWVGKRIHSVTLTMADEQTIGDRRPVLLYGDSFAECVTPRIQAWQGLLDASPEGKTHALINFGASGYGTDQSLTMLESTIGRYAARNPLVIFSIYLDEDPDRALLSFRGHPKPRCDLVGGKLVVHGLEVPDAATWWEENPVGVASYAWRLFRGPRGPLPEAWQRRLDPTATNTDMMIAINRALLARLHEQLTALNIEHVVLGFHGCMMLENPLDHIWREEFVSDACRELGMHYLSARPFLLNALGGQADSVNALVFGTDGEADGHYNACGNRVVFEAMRQAIAGRYEVEDVSGVQAAVGR